MSPFGVAMPRLLFFWKQCRTTHGLLELHGVDGAVRAPGIVFQHLEHAGAAKALEHLRCVVLIAGLRKGQGVAEKPPHVGR